MKRGKETEVLAEDEGVLGWQEKNKPKKKNTIKYLVFLSSVFYYQNANDNYTILNIITSCS